MTLLSANERGKPVKRYVSMSVYPPLNYLQPAIQRTSMGPASRKAEFRTESTVT